MANANTVVEKLQKENDALKALISNSADALKENIEHLRSVINKGDLNELLGIADDIEQNTITLETTTTSTTTVSVDEPLTVSPDEVTVSRNAMQQFTASEEGCTWLASHGEVDEFGLYEPPTDTTVMQDMVQATSADKKKTGQAVVMITNKPATKPIGPARPAKPIATPKRGR